MDLTSQLRGLYAPGVAYEIATPERPIPEMVLEVASRYPERAAIDFFARQLTYAELAEDMRRAAGALHQAGVRPGDRVALVMPNCPQHAVAVLGTMLLGAVVVDTIRSPPLASWRASTSVTALASPSHGRSPWTNSPSSGAATPPSAWT